MLPLSRNSIVLKLLAASAVIWLCALPAAQSLKASPGPLAIEDYKKHLNSSFPKEKRKSTRFIIVHTSEAGLKSTLRTLSQGKKVKGGYRTHGGHAHYAIARDGRIFRIMDHRLRADHAGLSMWQGIEDLSSHSLGIELVGYHYDTITPRQYRSLSALLDRLQATYKVPDKNVLAHSQISYGRPNPWFKRSHRGRKRCALNFDRAKAGLNDTWAYDPDVRAGRLLQDRQIKKMFYTKRPLYAAAKPKTASPPPAEVQVSNIIGPDNTAWNIAGEDFDSSQTIYILPGKVKKALRGDQVKNKIGWHRIPPGTQVLLNQPMGRERKIGPIFAISKDYTAWSFAGAAYRKPSTIYFLPGDKIVPGNLVEDWDDLPDGTRLIIGYRGPRLIESRPGHTAWGIAGRAHNHKETIYHIPGIGPVTGDRVDDFSDLPDGTRIFVKLGTGTPRP